MAEIKGYYNKSVNILIIHNYTLKNLGDYAILKGMIDSIRKVATSYGIRVNFYALSLTPDYDQKMMKEVFFVISVPPPVFSVKDYFFSLTFMLMSLIWAIIFRLSRSFIDMSFLFPRSYRTTLKAYCNADIVVCRATDAIFCPEVFGFIPTIKGIYQLILAYLLNKDVMIYAQTILPVRRKLTGYLYKKIIYLILNKAKIVTVRDTYSFNFLRYDVGFKRCLLTADPSYLLQIPLKSKHKFSSRSGITVGIIPRAYLSSMEKYETYIECIAEGVKYLIEKYSATIVLFFQ